MAAKSPAGEEVAGTVPLAIFVASTVVIILTAEFYREFGEGNSVGLLGVALGFFDLAN
jgi:hypothetical protein